ncbi:MAG TPA: SsrA-binding protein SmpB [Patescibacteria group bacterium]|nr:SsrA-binding protein SmpB [Patescibacteria group bacterium]
MGTLAFNRQARREYEILKTYEAGMVLKGYEVKSVKSGQINLKGSYIVIKRIEGKKAKSLAPFLVKAHIPIYKPAGQKDEYDPYRDRQLLLNRVEISQLIGKAQEAGLTLIPLKVYTKHNLLKLEIGVGRGKKKFDKREDIKNRDLDRKINDLKKRRF